ncbi:hypothetical protein CH375_12420 [Leptospira ellisii]|uniref:Uncharacterized protein n=1 Tax=Leptospira ellisii TaxID=2023197 RepID=A0A2N0BJL9_9LEPT|nr:hypothetical protein CH379_03010 [Leptospira ellisii]PKA04197.1 hypothetical protein CH375_12420 [Leptospira ellisii]
MNVFRSLESYQFYLIFKPTMKGKKSGPRFGKNGDDNCQADGFRFQLWKKRGERFWFFGFRNFLRKNLKKVKTRFLAGFTLKKKT